MLNEKRTGPIAALDGSVNPARSDKQGNGVVTAGHGAYNEAVSRGKVFIAANQAAVTTTVALALTQTGICVSNPPGSDKLLSILKVGWAFSVAPAGSAPAFLAGGYAATGGVSAHTTPLTVYNAKLGAPAGAVGLADAAATIVAPINILPLIGGFTNATLFAQPMAMTEIGGSVVVPPGAYVFLPTLTVAVGFGCIVWEEIPV